MKQQENIIFCNAAEEELKGCLSVNLRTAGGFVVY